ncbi:hypothetical protein CMK12_10955 [Candidatus Poribacteria bacterium]|nr:hypothetical protein [Candidatus Poribacteria bacterium]
MYDIFQTERICMGNSYCQWKVKRKLFRLFRRRNANGILCQCITMQFFLRMMSASTPVGVGLGKLSEPNKEEAQRHG